jgi:hypothetical protein
MFHHGWNDGFSVGEVFLCMLYGSQQRTSLEMRCNFEFEKSKRIEPRARNESGVSKDDAFHHSSKMDYRAYVAL